MCSRTSALSARTLEFAMKRIRSKSKGLFRNFRPSNVIMRRETLVLSNFQLCFVFSLPENRSEHRKEQKDVENRYSICFVYGGRQLMVVAHVLSLLYLCNTCTCIPRVLLIQEKDVIGYYELALVPFLFTVGTSYVYRSHSKLYRHDFYSN